MSFLFLMASFEDDQVLVNTVEIGSRKRFPLLQTPLNAPHQFIDKM